MDLRGDKAARAFLLVALWVSATLIVGVVAWSAVGRLGREGLANTQAPLSQSEVRRELTQVTRSTPITTRPPTTPASSTASSPPPSQSTSPPPSQSTGTPPGQHTRHSASWTITGGRVGASCQGSLIHLLFYVPADGWGAELKDRGPEKIRVEFSRDGDDSKLEAVCSNGIPTLESSDDG